MPAINEAENPSVNTTLSLDISLCVECGNEGKWVVISSVIKEVGPVAVKPIGVNKSHNFKIVLLNGSGPRPFATWKPKAHDGSLKNLGYKSRSQHFNSKPILGVTQTGASASSNTALLLLRIRSSHAISSFACNSAVQSCVASSQSDVSGCHESGLGSSPLSGVNVSEAPNSRLVPLLVLLGFGLLESQPPLCVASSLFDVLGCHESGLGSSLLSGVNVSEAPNSRSVPLQVLLGSGFWNLSRHPPFLRWVLVTQ